MRISLFVTASLLLLIACKKDDPVVEPTPAISSLNCSAYNASKFGLNGFSEAMMLDHRKDKIRVTYVMPGSVDTDFNPRTGPASWKIAPEDVAVVVLSVLRMPERTTVSRVEMRPSIPPK